MLRISIAVLAMTMLGAPMIQAGLADQARERANALAAQAGPVNEDRALDIASSQGVAHVEAVSFSGGAWRITGESEDGRVLEVGIAQNTGGVHVLQHGVES